MSVFTIANFIIKVPLELDHTVSNRRGYSRCTHHNTFRMSVLLETSAGDIVIDLLVDYSPKLCEKYDAPPSQCLLIAERLDPNTLL
jgi:hypothetical protein